MTKRFENRLDKSNVKFNTLNPVWDNEKEDAFNVFEMIDLLNDYEVKYQELEQKHQYNEEFIADVMVDCERLEKENEWLKKEKENWKSSACSNANFNSILLNELSIAQEQGYGVSDPFKRLMNEKGDVE